MRAARSCFLAWVVVVLFAASVGQAAEFHVSSTGSDEGDGTEAAPFRTISRGVEELQPGDTCTVHAGIFRESVTLPRSGEPGRPIRIRAAGGGGTVVSACESLIVDWTPRSDEIGRAHV